MAAAVALALAGCVSDGTTTASTGRPQLVPIAFESITGAPQPVFNRLVDDLGREAETRRVLIVSRNDAATYRVRGYLSAHADAGQGRVAWVFDVFDADRRRALRLAGEEPVAAFGDAWSAASDAVVARIAARGVEGLAQWLAEGAPAPGTAPAGAPAAATVAAAGASRPAGFATAAFVEPPVRDLP